MKRKSKERNYAVEEASVKKPETLDAFQVEKEFADILNYERKQRNHLLGDFAGESYKIPDNIMERLVELPKAYDVQKDNILYASTKLANFVLNFKVEFDISADYCTAKMSIIEIEQGIEEDIKHTTLIASIVEPYKFDFINEICKLWHIYNNRSEEHTSELQSLSNI